MTARQSPPTDEPVVRNDLWHCTRQIDQGAWRVSVFATDPVLRIVTTALYVVDDFGHLLPLPDDAQRRNEDYWFSTFQVDQAATEWWQAQCDAAGHRVAERAKRERTSLLAQPPTVTVAIETEPPHPWCVASIIVGPDPRLDAPMYSLQVDREAPVILSHAQLCALALAAGELITAAIPQGPLQ